MKRVEILKRLHVIEGALAMSAGQLSVLSPNGAVLPEVRRALKAHDEIKSALKGLKK